MKNNYGIKKQLIKNSLMDIFFLNEQWTDGSIKGYVVEISKDIHKKTEKINASILIRKDIEYIRHGKDINNAVILEIPKIKMIICSCYARPGRYQQKEIEINER